MSGVPTGGDDRLQPGKRRVGEQINGTNLRVSAVEK